MKRPLRHVSFANLTSVLALFVALGGTSYALTLPRNSVGATQLRSRAVGTSEIRTGAVRSSEVRDRALRVRDLSLSARKALQGETGPMGPVGPQGPSGITYKAAINSNGDTLRGKTDFSTRRGTNEFVVGFDRGVDDCVSTATLATVEGPGTTTPPPGRITVARESGRVLVRTFDASGQPVNLPFHLIVAC